LKNNEICRRHGRLGRERGGAREISALHGIRGVKLCVVFLGSAALREEDGTARIHFWMENKTNVMMMSRSGGGVWTSVNEGWR